MRIFIIMTLILACCIALAATDSTPASKVAPEKPLTPIEMYRNFEAQQVGLQQQAQKLQAEYEQKMQLLQSSYDQLQGAKELLLIQTPTLAATLKAEAEAKAKEKPTMDKPKE